MSLKTRVSYKFKCFLTKVSPELNTRILYRVKFGKRLDLNNPKTLNEKILWLKFNTYWENSLVKQCADKYRVRDYIEKAGCGSLLNELIGAYKTPEEIEWNKLPNSFVLKLNVGCGRNYIVVDKQKEDFSKLTTIIHRWLEDAPKLYIPYSEMQYKDVEPVVIIEKYLGGPNGELPEDYKFYCINGKCRMIMFCNERGYDGHGAKYYYVDRDWNMIANTAGRSIVPVEKPTCLDRAIEFAEILSRPFPFVRVDFYLQQNKIIFGELTFTPAAGMDIDFTMVPLGKEEDIDTIFGAFLSI